MFWRIFKFAPFNCFFPFTVKDPHGETGEWYFFIHHDNYQNKQKEKENIPKAGNWIGKYFKKEQRMMTNWTGKDSKEEQRMIANWIGKDFKEEQRMTANRNRKDFKKEQRTYCLSNWFAKDFKEQKNRKIQMIENGSGQEFQQEEQEKEKVRIVGNGSGFWRSVGKKHPIYDVNGNVFAFKIHFIYYSGSINRGKKTHWRMEEYHLVASGRRGNQLVHLLSNTLYIFFFFFLISFRRH